MTIAAHIGPVLTPGGAASGNKPKIAFLRWLSGNPGKRPSDFRPVIKEAEFAFRCRAPSVPTCDDLGGARIMERQLRNLELGLCCGWYVLTPAEARSLGDWLDAVLPHHPWCTALEWRESTACRALHNYSRDERAGAVNQDLMQSLTAAGFGDVLSQAWTIETWRDAQALVLGAWLGGELLVDEYGYLVRGWKEAFARALAAAAAPVQ